MRFAFLLRFPFEEEVYELEVMTPVWTREASDCVVEVLCADIVRVIGAPFLANEDKPLDDDEETEA